MTYLEIINQLDKIAVATHVGKDKLLIKGTPHLELERATLVKNIEDMIVDMMGRDGVIYERQYESMYPKI